MHLRGCVVTETTLSFPLRDGGPLRLRAADALHGRVGAERGGVFRGVLRRRGGQAGNARIENAGKYQSCMVSKLSIMYIAEPAHGGRPARLHVRRGYGCTGCWTAYVV